MQQQSHTRADAVGQAPELASRLSLTTTRVARILALVTDPWAGSCKGPPVLIALAVSGCMSSPAGSVGGVEFGSDRDPSVALSATAC